MINKAHFLIFLFFFHVLNLYAQSSDSIEIKVNKLLSKMRLEDKIGQLSLKGTSSRSKGLSDEIKEYARTGKIGAVLNLTDPLLVLELQKIAVEESPLGIPLLFGRDVIHGYKTIFPIPLGLAATWNPTLAEKSSEVAAREAYSKCINWTFAPMVDICRDARWGRIAESPGEDSYLASLFAKAYIKGFQGKKLNEPGKILACAKHFAAYGAAEGGRDYNTVTMSEQLLRDVYLKPFKSAAEAGAATFMTSFNDVNGIPSTGNSFLLKKILREEWNYKGFVVSDWNSVEEMIVHGYCEDPKDAALKAATAGMDMEMTGNAYMNHLKSLVESGKVSEKELDEMVKNILRMKVRAELFENPYFKDKEKFALLDKTSLALAKESAIKSCVLLKNEQSLLPIVDNRKIAVIGPLANAPKEQLGTWIFDGDKKDAQTPLTALQEARGEGTVFYAPGLNYSREKIRDGFENAIAAAKKSDVIFFFGGEEAILSGEAHSRADISLPGLQEELIKELYKTGKPIVLILMSGRPNTISTILPYVNSVMVAWHPGTMAGPALSDLLLGKAVPSGRLPVTWPKVVGQIPIYYNHTNTGRPADVKSFVAMDDIPVEAWQSSLGNNSHYLDAGFQPQYPFGFGLSYTNFEYSNIILEKKSLRTSDSIVVYVDVENKGTYKGLETVQLYVRDLVGSMVRPVRELKAFTQIEIAPGEKKKIRLTVAVTDLGYYHSNMVYSVESGNFQLWVGPNAETGLTDTFAIH